MKISQYEIVIVNLDPTIGSEIKKTRPCVVVSPNEINDYLRTIIIAPITSKSKNYPTRIEIKVKGKKNWVVIEQIRTIDKRRVYKKVGNLTDAEISEVKKVIKETFVD
ncbi:type II toxin-antitoxin system PemK/MazF family toxin [Phaeodactylibacter xiamenensis]|jgi:mRNA interferase MazF|uniref:type II toxin-antitoxin system PemK/MazF family toxin n=1 Tax=Phaeodactylibacter xiamenensis TaxID=1524460 RepID=UPI003BA8EA2D